MERGCRPEISAGGPSGRRACGEHPGAGAGAGPATYPGCGLRAPCRSLSAELRQSAARGPRARRSVRLWERGDGPAAPCSSLGGPWPCLPGRPRCPELSLGGDRTRRSVSARGPQAGRPPSRRCAGRGVTRASASCSRVWAMGFPRGLHQFTEEGGNRCACHLTAWVGQPSPSAGCQQSGRPTLLGKQDVWTDQPRTCQGCAANGSRN